jgi:DNA-binding XRE family transcriptional regulator
LGVAQSRQLRAAYRDARAEYERIRALREVSPIAAYLRERRFELGLTQEEVAKAAGTSYSAVSRLEKGTHIPAATDIAANRRRAG